MKILHTSDWHLGRLFHNVSLLEDQAQLLQQIHQQIDEHNVDALIIAGDIYDRAVPPAQAVTLLNNFLNQCADKDLTVILISGNHDSAERLGFGAQALSRAKLHIISRLEDCDKAIEVVAANGQIAHVYCIPYCDPEHVKDVFGESASTIQSFDDGHNFLLDKINASIAAHSQKEQQPLNILVSHCFAQHGDASESERPLSIGGSDWVSVEPLKSFDYVALGHLHRPQQIACETIRYSGSLMKYSFSEAHYDKSSVLAQWDNKDQFTYKLLPLTSPRDLQILEGTLQELLDQGRERPDHERQDYYLIRLTDTHAILDVMAKLRSIYPNVLHLERPGLTSQVEHQQGQEKLKRGIGDLFSDFFQQVNGTELSQEQKHIIDTISLTTHNTEVDS